MKFAAVSALAFVCALSGACATAGSRWMAEPLPEEDWEGLLADAAPASSGRAPRPGLRRVHVIGGASEAAAAPETRVQAAGVGAQASAAHGGRSLGRFRNTYYDFPDELEFAGPAVPLKNARCETIRAVPRGFFESLCVQGSGSLRGGPTVSFARRDCECAEVCPRTSQRICFDTLDPAKFPWGRGATGKAITPLLTVAVDSEVIALGTSIYVPELDGLPRDAAGAVAHDGCFIAEDRGIRVKGKHLDVFTGHSVTTALWNRLVPSNRGVEVILDSARCRRAP